MFNPKKFYHQKIFVVKKVQLFFFWVILVNISLTKPKWQLSEWIKGTIKAGLNSKLRNHELAKKLQSWLFCSFVMAAKNDEIRNIIFRWFCEILKPVADFFQHLIRHVFDKQKKHFFSSSASWYYWILRKDPFVIFSSNDTWSSKLGYCLFALMNTDLLSNLGQWFSG